MTHPDDDTTRTSLRRLVAPHALAFGARLLSRGTGTDITFREFLAVARELVTLLPEQSAVYLAALVALDMGTADCVLAERPQPSRN